MVRSSWFIQDEELSLAARSTACFGGPMKSCVQSLLALIFLLTTSTLLVAQDTASITGTVTDSTGASVANAQVSVSVPDKSFVRTTTTNGNGDYLVAGIPIGAAYLEVSAPGFKKYEAKDVILHVADKARIDVSLQVGAPNVEIVVQGTNVAQIETQSSEISGVVTGAQLSQLELNGRAFTQLVTLVPGVSGTGGSDEGGVGKSGDIDYSINGGRIEYNNWEVDGGDIMDNGSNGSLNIYPNMDAIAEFKVLTSSYGAQYGRNGNGTIEIETKSGTAQFHGDAFFFGRNEFFDAYNYFDPHGEHKPSYKRDDWGYTVGGPVYIPGVFNTEKKKTFFFWSQEWRRQRNPAVFNLNVPSDLERTGNFGDLCPASNGSNSDCPIQPSTINGVPNPSAGQPFPGNTVTVDSNAAALLSLIPHADSTLEGYPAFNQAISEPESWREELLRIDHNFSEKLRATFRYTHDSWQKITPTPMWVSGSFPTIQSLFKAPGISMVARLNANPSPTWLNELVASYTSNSIFSANIGAWGRPAGLTMTSFFNNGFGGRAPGVTIQSGNTAYGDGFTENPSWVVQGPYNANPTYTLRDNVTKIAGKHNLQFGAYFVAAEKNEFDATTTSINGLLTFGTSSPISTGNAFADFLIGNAAQYQQESAQLKYYNRYKIFEPYLQDDWRVTNKLTLNLGLRMSLLGTYFERYHNAYNFDPAAYSAANAPQIDISGSITGQAGALIPGIGNPVDGTVQCGVGGSPRGCMAGHLFNPAPRIGFAFDPRGNGKTAIRGGYGIFYEHTNGNESNTEGLEGNPPGAYIPSQYNASGYTNIGGAGLLFPLSAISIPDKAIWPYIQQYHFDIQQQLPKNVLLTVAYVGSKGTHLPVQRDINQLHPVPPSQNPYSTGQFLQSADCNFGTVDSRGVPTNAVTSYGAPVPYIPPPILGGIPSGPAVNLAVACGVNVDPLRTGFPGWGSLTRLENVANSSYNALQVSLRRTVGRLTLSAAYTYAHSIDDSSDRYDGNFVDSYNLNFTRTSSNFDQRQIFKASYVYGLPSFKQSRLAHAVFGEWQLSGITIIETGTPFSVANGTTFGDPAGVANTNIANSSSFADIIGDPRSGFSHGVPVGGIGPQLYNPNAYQVPQGLTFGDSGRNSLRLPRHTNFDAGLFKRIPVHESATFELRWEVFNIFNHTEFNSIDSSLGSSTFLQANGAHDARIMQLGAKFLF